MKQTEFYLSVRRRSIGYYQGNGPALPSFRRPSSIMLHFDGQYLESDLSLYHLPMGNFESFWVWSRIKSPSGYYIIISLKKPMLIHCVKNFAEAFWSEIVINYEKIVLVIRCHINRLPDVYHSPLHTSLADISARALHWQAIFCRKQCNDQ